MTGGERHTWPEPVVRVQSLAKSGIHLIPAQYIQPPSSLPSSGEDTEVPTIDLEAVAGGDERGRRRAAEGLREWGVVQIVNHGVAAETRRRAREAWGKFFAEVAAEEKEEYANSPRSYEGYGSRMGVDEGAVLDWSDYFFLHFLPLELGNPSNHPKLPPSCRKITEEYGEEMMKLCKKMMRVLSETLGLSEDYVEKAFGGEKEMGTCLRVNLYPKCPQPELTLGLSSHSDPGGFTIVMADENVDGGLQVLKGNVWVTVKPLPNAFIFNIGDQIQVLSNGIYKSVNHRVVANSSKDRLSIAFFCNPKSDLLIEPAKELLSEHSPPIYSPMTFDQYRLYIRQKGPCGKSQLEAHKFPTVWNPTP